VTHTRSTRASTTWQTPVRDLTRARATFEAMVLEDPALAIFESVFDEIDAKVRSHTLDAEAVLDLVSAKLRSDVFPGIEEALGNRIAAQRAAVCFRLAKTHLIASYAGIRGRHPSDWLRRESL
jgi:hypothetical protein